MISPSISSPEKTAAAQANRALKKAVAAMEQAEHSAVTWFGEILRRELYRQLGHSSIYQYADIELKWSRTRTGDFIRLARKLETLPRVKKAVARGEVGYTKARELIKVATPRTEKGWVEEAKSSNRGELARKVKRVQDKARKRRRRQRELVPEPELKALCADLPVRLSLEMSPEQFARYEALIERLHKLGGLGDKAEALLQGLALLVQQRGTGESANSCKKNTSKTSAPGGHRLWFTCTCAPNVSGRRWRPAGAIWNWAGASEKKRSVMPRSSSKEQGAARRFRRAGGAR